MKKNLATATLLILLGSTSPCLPQSIKPGDSALRQAVATKVEAESGSLLELYKTLHANPELSFQETKTARRIADELKQAGLEVTEKVGGHGIVGIFHNGAGPTILLRTELDALPVKEATGLPYASKVRTTDEQGNEVEVMHACGHDIHMTVFIGAARTLVALKDRWQGTLMMVGQPAEERVGGAKAMLADGLFTRFPTPAYCVALHCANDMPFGTVGYTEGYTLANVDSVDILIRGIGGHGAWPHTTKDPIVLAAQTVLALQTIVSREVPPTEPAVVTVGSIHGGAKRNVIPEEVRLQLTLRCYSDEVREQLIASIRRITHGLGQAAGLPEDKMPVVTIADESARATYNDPALTKRLAAVFQDWLGAGMSIPRKPVMGAEDFGLFGRTEQKIPICMFWLGTISAESVKQSISTGKSLPSLHSALFAPVPQPAIKTGVTALTAVVLDLGRKASAQ